MNGLVLAVDGGQSGIRMRVSDSEKVIETQGASRLEGDVMTRVHDLVVEAMSQELAKDLDTVVLGLSTSPAAGEDSLRLARKLGESLGARRVLITDDGVTHHASHFKGLPGIVLAIGTGVACVGVGNKQNAIVSVSGYGYLLGDDGGAFSMGRHALRLVLDARFEDSSSAISQLAQEHFGPLVDLAAEVHSRPRAVNEIAHFALEVLRLADSHEQARAIIDHASGELAQSVQRGIVAADLAPERAELVWSGRLFAHSPLARESLERALIGLIPGLKIHQAESNPLEGGIWLGQTADFGPYKNSIQAWSV